jgi:hypothetical protein
MKQYGKQENSKALTDQWLASRYPTKSKLLLQNCAQTQIHQRDWNHVGASCPNKGATALMSRMMQQIILRCCW